MASGKGTAEGQFTGKDGCTDNAGKTTSVVSGVGGVRSPDAEHVEHSSLGV